MILTIILTDKAPAALNIVARIDGYDPERGVKCSGHREYFLKGKRSKRRCSWIML